VGSIRPMRIPGTFESPDRNLTACRPPAYRGCVTQTGERRHDHRSPLNLTRWILLSLTLHLWGAVAMVCSPGSCPIQMLLNLWQDFISQTVGRLHRDLAQCPAAHVRPRRFRNMTQNIGHYGNGLRNMSRIYKYIGPLLNRCRD
jgi:hypothetical protein